jgi:hypothetical protein
MHAFIPDRPAEQDALGREQFAKSLANTMRIASTGEGIVVGIEGDWGSGKSTIIGFIKNALEKVDQEKAPVIVEFNPWLLSNTGAIVDALITQIAATINTNPISPEKALEAGSKLLGYIGLIGHLKVLKHVPGIAAFGNIAEGIADAAEKIKEGSSKAKDALEEMKKMLPTLDLSKRKSDVVSALREFDNSIIVILDDVDRLPADEIRTIIQVIKAVADFPRITYLLSYDRNIIAKALGNGDAAAGQHYLEKIIQVAYPIPPLLPYQIKDLIDGKIKMLFADLKLTPRSYESVTSVNYKKALKITADLIRQPRDAVRLMNRLILSLPATKDEVNILDVIVFEALTQRFPKIRESVHSAPVDFIGQSFQHNTEWDDKENNFDAVRQHGVERSGDNSGWQKHLPLNDPDRAMADKTCVFLFSAQGNEQDQREPKDELRLADPVRLARYFHMTSMDGVPEVKRIHRMLRDPVTLTDYIATTDLPLLDTNLGWLDSYIRSAQIIDTAGCIAAVINRANEAQADGSLTFDRIEKFMSLLLTMIRKSEGEIREQSFSTIIRTAPLSISCDILGLAKPEISHALRVTPLKALTIDNQALLKMLVNEWSERVRAAVVNETLHFEDEMRPILLLYARINNNFTDIYNFVAQICATDKGFRKFLSEIDPDIHMDEVGEFVLVRDAGSLAMQIRNAGMADDYWSLIRKLDDDDWAKKISELSDARLKRDHMRVHLEQLQN